MICVKCKDTKIVSNDFFLSVRIETCLHTLIAEKPLCIVELELYSHCGNHIKEGIQCEFSFKEKASCFPKQITGNFTVRFTRILNEISILTFRLRKQGTGHKTTAALPVGRYTLDSRNISIGLLILEAFKFVF
uniref:Uncharacterized protein n=2 Tax=Micrurus lemniscatus lemniscatus TaxID=129467 RepID=A0A2D4JHJ8_MICLE